MKNGDNVRVNGKDEGIVYDYNPETGAFSLRTETAWVVYPCARRKNIFLTWLFKALVQFRNHDYKVEYL